MTQDSLPEWERLLAAERHLQALVPGSVLVGGTERFEEVLADLEAAAGGRRRADRSLSGRAAPPVDDIA